MTNLRKTKPEPGFSLVELLVVVAILAILAAIAIPLFLNQRSKAAQGAVQSDARNLATNLTTLFANLPPNVAPNPSLSGNTLTVGGENINFTPSSGVTVSLTTAPTPANGSGLKIYNPDNPTYACTISFPATVQLGWASGFQPACGTIISEQGNLLTSNVATGTDALGTTVGWTPYYGGTRSSTTEKAWQGTRSLTKTTDVFGTSLIGVGWTTGGVSSELRVPVTGGQTYTFTGRASSSTNDGITFVSIYWYKADNTAASTTYDRSSNISLSSWSEVTFSALAPADATTAGIFSQTQGATPEAKVYYDGWGFWQGEGGTWSAPGVPIVQP